MPRDTEGCRAYIIRRANVGIDYSIFLRIPTGSNTYPKQGQIQAFQTRPIDRDPITTILPSKEASAPLFPLPKRKSNRIFRIFSLVSRGALTFANPY